MADPCVHVILFVCVFVCYCRVNALSYQSSAMNAQQAIWDIRVD
jgi:hypothetical protein